MRVISASRGLKHLGLGRMAVRLAVLWVLPACVTSGGIDLAPKYKGDTHVVPALWKGSSPFVEARPSDSMLRQDWWRAFNDPVLDKLEAEAMASNADLHAAAERFLQARDDMMKARSRLLPQLGIGVDASYDKQSAETLFRSETEPLRDNDLSLGGMASWEPDIWSRLRNSTRRQIYHAEKRAAEYALARLSLQAEVAADYFALRGLDAQAAVYRQSIKYYKESLNIAEVKYRGKIAAELDVARAKYQLASTQARNYGLQARRQVVEHALAVLVNTSPATFTVAPVNELEVVHFELPASLPSLLLQRRPDVAAMEREMAMANRGIGIARSAFFPNIPLGANGGISGHFSSLAKVSNFFWSVGAFLKMPVFQGGYRRAQLQKSWSMYRETEDRYRSVVLNAFREVEDGLSITKLLTLELQRQEDAVGAAWRQQDLSMELYRGGLASSLDLINAQVNTLDSRLTWVDRKVELLNGTVGLIRALGGGWNRSDLPADGDIQPFGVLQYSKLEKPEPAGNIDVQTTGRAHIQDLARPVRF